MDYNILIRLVLAHLLSDFVFQSRKWAEEKDAKGFHSRYLYLNICPSKSAILALPAGLYLGDRSNGCPDRQNNRSLEPGTYCTSNVLQCLSVQGQGRKAGSSECREMDWYHRAHFDLRTGRRVGRKMKLSLSVETE